MVVRFWSFCFCVCGFLAPLFFPQKMGGGGQGTFAPPPGSAPAIIVETVTNLWYKCIFSIVRVFTPKTSSCYFVLHALVWYSSALPYIHISLLVLYTILTYVYHIIDHMLLYFITGQVGRQHMLHSSLDFLLLSFVLCKIKSIESL